MASSNEENSLPLPAKWVPGRQANSMILIDPEGIKMRYKSKNSTKKFYICSKKTKTNCPVSVTVETEKDLIVETNGTHNHDNDIVKGEVLAIANEKISEAATNVVTSPRSVLQDISYEVLNNANTKSGKQYIPKSNTITKALSRKRKSELNCPQLPNSMEELQVPEIMKKTPDGEEFVILEEQINKKGDKVIGFASPTMLQVLRGSKEWFIDGTWDIVAQTFFTQAWIIVAKLPSSEASVACAFFLLPDKQATTYKLALDALVDKEVPGPDLVHVDFEASEIKAIRDCMPASKIVTCQVHWKRALRKKMTELGILPFYNRSAQIQTYFRKIWSIAFVPIGDVVDVWEELKADSPELDENEMGAEAVNFFDQALENFFTYMEHTYIGSVQRKKERRLLYPFSFWNKHEEAIAEEELTNNSVESWNSVSKRSLPMKANIWKVMDALQKEDCLSRTKVIASASGTYTDPNPSRTKSIKQKKKQLSSSVRKYHSMLLGEWMNMMSSIYEYEG